MPSAPIARLNPRSTSSEIVNFDTGRQPSGAALPCEGELSRLRSGGTPASLLSSRHPSCRSIRGPGLLDERAEDLPHSAQEDSPSITVRDATIAGLESIKEGNFSDNRRLSRPLVKFVLESPSLLGYAPARYHDKRRLSRPGQNASVIKHNQSALGDKPAWAGLDVR